ncbi:MULTISPECIES: RrF2 family transcriptional regulator [Acetobacter]|jgi:Rrf2 family nitric oxide-sensitive transcriptional repressor|uniref:Rrf2 family nitric oxide-sensitive transcriptional repressor n=1 Tax=Acetobacter lovaniensis TaxID=104100 RepID=A0A841QD86_9PROT|nr:Rrf2 family transcriptional regulator [Acetobacter lovaniensis]MBB6456087.1 Rrf2 family nitric oxide-sensitive transcriptional repressor [Acetobacter lovaniensis]MCI1696983.1 Rrf2 family transcriptional regulator [Acetobacter lovaniensis]MCI1795134.1 Rrf2 family transcriptional regulator [Acetobacter lovaniensis]MCP1238083.1 Rrf2 family transcriptional regulator [Acetobacter lovaniensis]NHN80473.1 Rrf2 family transcriptional regulator [Acetobacter lovaniensis]
MRLTLYTDYALRTLLYLAVHTDRRVSIREVAQTYGISENHLVKIIHHLGRGGFVRTQRGRGGGLTLGRPAEEICVGDVVRHTEEDMVLVGCMTRNGDEGMPCLLAKGCSLRGVLEQALDAFMGVLDKSTLADMLHPYERRTLLQAAEHRHSPDPAGR